MSLLCLFILGLGDEWVQKVVTVKALGPLILCRNKNHLCHDQSARDGINLNTMDSDSTKSAFLGKQYDI